MALYEAYLAFHVQECQKYGAENTVVGMEVGNFVEFYGCGDSGADVSWICARLNITHTRRNKALPISPTNPSMAGFPSAALLARYLPLLLGAGKTLSLVTQVSSTPTVRREVTRVFSSSTYDPPDFWKEQCGDASRAGPLMSLFVTKQTPELTVGMATIDISTGESSAACACGIEAHTMQTVASAVAAASPSEVLITIVGPMPCEAAAKQAYQAFLTRLKNGCGLSTHSSIVVRMLVRGPSCSDQEEVLRRVFPMSGMLSGSVFSGLDKLPEQATSAFTLAVRFVHDHDNELILSRLRPPKLAYGQGKTVLMSRLAAQQLDLSGTVGLAHLLCSATRTPAGGRLLHRRLLTPTYDIAVLNLRLDRVEALIPSTRFVSSTPSALLSIQGLLGLTGDLERSFRRIMAPKQHVSPTWMRTTLALAIESAGEALCLSPWTTSQSVAHCQAIHATITQALGTSTGQSSAKGASSGLPYFVPGRFPKIDALIHAVAGLDAEVSKLVGTLNLMAGANDHFRVAPLSCTHDKEKGAAIGRVGITATPLRLTALKRAAHGRTLTVHVPGQGPLTLTVGEMMSDPKPDSWVRHPAIDALMDALSNACETLQLVQDQEWELFVENLVMEHGLHMHNIVEALAELDVCMATASNAVRMHHSRPHLVEGCAGRFEARGLRHPLIEHLRNDTQYVANDIALDPDSPTRGMLLYGVNASGKSSLMKSVGVALIMAQAGMYVACDSLLVCPYQTLCTRIGSRDDIGKGHSTFVVEMLELRDILTQAGEFGLVIGDELCSGTETVSAQAIVAAAIATLHGTRTSFVFATHLHGLADLPVVQALCPPLFIAHLAVRFVKDTLTYDRKLEAGCGRAVYGLEIAKGLDLPHAFLQIADKTRRHLMGVMDLIPTQRSPYNSRVGVGPCCVCSTTSVPRESHHIQHQAAADLNGFTGNFHKNRAFNLAILCRKCHDAVHAGRIAVNGFVDTCERGTVLDIVR